MFRNNLTKPLIFLTIFFVVIWFKSYVSIDPDFGWRLPTGQRIISLGVPETDIYSYTMSSFPWVDHAWLNDVLFALLYTNVGYLGLSFYTSLLTTSAIYFSFLATKSLVASVLNSKQKIDDVRLLTAAMPLIVLVCTSILKFTGVRAQTWTWLFLAVFINLVFNESLWSRYKKFTPLLFLVWANLHGGFVAGISILLIFVLARSFERKKILFDDMLTVLISFLATLFNPYFSGIYREVWSSVSDQDLGNRVVEWNSFFKSFNFAPMFLIIMSGVFVFMFRTRFGVGKVLIFLLLLYEAITVVRQVPLFSLFALPLGTAGILLFFNKISSDRESVRRFNKLFGYLLGLTLIIFVVEVLISIKASYLLSESKFYPKSAIIYLKNSPPKGNIFSEYGWGGYTIWKFPEKKVFIDGRMPSWRRNNFPVNESGDAMKDYVEIISGDVSYGSIFDKYNIDTVVWSQKKDGGFLDKLENKYFNRLSPFYKMLGKEQTNFNFLEKLEEDGWKIVYSDNVSVVLQK